MRTEKIRAFSSSTNSFGETQTDDLGFDKNIYYMTEEEFKNASLPDGNYGALANDFLRSFIKFESWDDPKDCKRIIFEVVNGKMTNFRDVSTEIYQASLNFVKFEK